MSAQQAMLDLLVMAEEMTRRGDDVPELKTCQAYAAEIKRCVAEFENKNSEEIKRLRALTAWRDIADAPKDGTYVLLFFPGPFMDRDSPGIAVGCYFQDTRRWWVSAIWSSGNAIKEPAHWQPLPEPPQPQE